MMRPYLHNPYKKDCDCWVCEDVRDAQEKTRRKDVEERTKRVNKAVDEAWERKTP